MCLFKPLFSLAKQNVSIPLASNGNWSDKVVSRPCEDGVFQSYQLEHGEKRMVTLENKPNRTVHINREWMGLPDLYIPVESDSYCVSL